ncbi:MAG: dienelactone hydrolase family protein [Myxococcales bacterium]|nr:dienelactone hydrolase family protein [Myxococcales bacterium]
MPSVTLPGWTRGSFTHSGFTRDTHRAGSGPGVIVVHEIPGITPNVMSFAREVVDAGFTVVLPDLIGTPGRAVSSAYNVSSMAKLCVAAEFSTWAANQTSPIVAWLRALGAELHAELGGPGIGAIGMCFSGGFALAMMVDERMVAPVLSQPSLPFAISKRRGADLNLSPADRLAVQRRAKDGCQVLGLRFKGDRLVGTRFESLKRLLGDAFIAIELESQNVTDHSVLTEHRDEASVARVLDFFREKLLTPT